MSITKDYLQKNYWDDKKSIHTISKELGCYPNKVRREILKYYPALRSKSEAQTNALVKGVSVHPTKDRERTEVCCCKVEEYKQKRKG
jgi:hypothetical protein